MGDRTNLVMIIAGELLKKATYLLTMGLHPSEVVLGYELARDKALEELESAFRLSCSLRIQRQTNASLIRDRTHRTDARDPVDDGIAGSGTATDARFETIWFRRFAGETSRRGGTGGDASRS